MSGLRCQFLTVTLGGRAVLSEVDVSLREGTLVGLVGPNGAGKTTLLRALAGLVQPAQGRVLLDGKPLLETPRRLRARRIAYLPQGQRVDWPLSVKRLVELGRLPHLEPWASPGGADRAAVEEIVEHDTAALNGFVIELMFTGDRHSVLRGFERMKRLCSASAASLIAQDR